MIGGTRTSYDGLGNVTRLVEGEENGGPAGRITRNYYEAGGRLSTRHDAAAIPGTHGNSGDTIPNC